MEGGTNLEVSDKGDAVVHSHSADEEVFLDELGVVIRKVHHQVDMAVTDQTAEKEMSKKKWQTRLANLSHKIAIVFISIIYARLALIAETPKTMNVICKKKKKAAK